MPKPEIRDILEPVKAFPSKRLEFQKGRWFHNFIVLLDRMEAVPWPAWLGLAALGLLAAAAAWDTGRWYASGVAAAALFCEAAALLVGRALGRSTGPFGGPFFLFASTHLAAMVAAGFFPASFAFRIWVHVLLQGGLALAMLYGFLIEPFKVSLRRERIELGESTELRILLISDLHMDRPGTRERKVMEHARGFGPDLILWPGDFTSLSHVHDPVTCREMRKLIIELCSLAPVYLSRGTDEVDELSWVESFIHGTCAVLLESEAVDVTVSGVSIRIAGIPCSGAESERESALARLVGEGDGRPFILLHHTPDMVEAAAAQGVGLYVAGHTHGGQIRLPLVGPFYTASRYGQKYCGGSYLVGGMNLVVSMGIGLEGGGAPRLRFMCPPEVVGIEARFP